MDDSKKIKGKDLINIGIFAAIYFVVIMALAMLGFIPIFMPTYSVLMPLLGGIVFMLFLTKVKKFGIDVGVDANNYEPMSLADVRFYINAIDKGYYDDDVWCQ